MGKEARNFSTATAYSIDDLVLYNGKLYQFIQNHSAGAWDPDDVIPFDTEIQQQIERILTAYDNAEKSADFVETVVFEESLIEGTRYKYIFTNAADPR